MGLRPAQVVLDVASGTGVVARAAAAAVGAGGRVIASDISAAMLANASTGVDPHGAPVETLECSATALELPEACVDVVLCQQGFPFIPDRDGAAAEMRRVLRTGGKVGVAVWLSGVRLEPFEIYFEVLDAEGIAAPPPNDPGLASLKMSESELDQALARGGFGEVVLTTQTLELEWSSPEAAAAAITGTPYGPVVASPRSRAAAAPHGRPMRGHDRS